MSEIRSGRVVKTRSSVLETDVVILVGSLTIWVSEKVLHNSKKSCAIEELGYTLGGSFFHIIFGILKSPSKKIGTVV